MSEIAEQPATPAASLEKGTLTAAFNSTKRDFIHGELTQESIEAVARMHQRFTQRIQDTVDAALPGCQSDEMKKAATAYCIALSRTRKEITPKQLAEKAKEGPEALRKDTEQMLESLNELEATLRDELGSKSEKPVEIGARPDSGFRFFEKLANGFRAIFSSAAQPVKAANDDAPPAPEEEKKTEPDSPMMSLLKAQMTRVYFKLTDYSSSAVQPYVEAYLKERGYTIADYQDGYATDNRKNKHKIGKLLKDAPGLLEAFREDSFRMGRDLMVVLTRSYDDLARASYGRGWQSCRASSSNAVCYGVKEVDIGVISAYLIRQDDPDIHNPLGRINLKPYDTPAKGGDGWGAPRYTAEEQKNLQTVYLTFNPIGLHHPGFVDAVNRFADEHFNMGKYGLFKLRYGCEAYHEFQERTRIPLDAEGALKAIGAKFDKDKDGKITVHGDLRLAGLGLSRLPDFSAVTVEGGIDVSNNKLLTLEGLPRSPVTFLNVSSNLLVCFKGAPPKVEGNFNYKDCAYLTTTYGAPEARTYTYGNGQRDSGRYATSDKCIGPIEEPARFPSFKRKD